MFSHEYYFKDDRRLFVCNQTLNKGVRNQLAIKDGVLKGCEVVLSFKRFNGAKTGIGVGTWLYDEHLEKGLKPSYVVYHATDGASNAVASANHYRLLAEMNGVYESRILHNTCLAHQNNRSAKSASGTGDFKTCSNPVLQDILNKVHQIIARVHWTHHRIKAIRRVQKTANRSSIVMPVPSVVTCWVSSSMEVTSLNRIMGDFNKGLNIILDTTDSKLLEERDGVIRPRSDFAFTPTDRTIFRQFECGSQPCLLLSKFFQLHKPIIHETLFMMVARLTPMRETSFLMYGDILHSPEVLNLTKWTKTIRVVSSHPGDSQEEQPMDVCIQHSRYLYANAMSWRCGLTESDGTDALRIPHILGVAALLNPMLGGTFSVLFQYRKLCIRS
jgi:hypothetical protein